MLNRLVWAIALAALAGSAAARDMYTCVGPGGTKVFSQTPCGKDAQATPMRTLQTVGDSPAVLEAADQAAKEREAAAKAAEAAPAAPVAAPPPEAYQCNVANGEVFYQHSKCPANVTVYTTSWVGNRAITSESFAPVEPVPVSKAYACDRIRAGGGREGGHGRDEWYSAYDRRQGRDPCGR